MSACRAACGAGTVSFTLCSQMEMRVLSPYLTLRIVWVFVNARLLSYPVETVTSACASESFCRFLTRTIISL